MTHDDILHMAQEAGFEIDCCSLEWHDRIERFAHLVAAAEREAIAQMLEDTSGTGKIISCKSAAAAIRARTQA